MFLSPLVTRALSPKKRRGPQRERSQGKRGAPDPSPNTSTASGASGPAAMRPPRAHGSAVPVNPHESTFFDRRSPTKQRLLSGETRAERPQTPLDTLLTKGRLMAADAAIVGLPRVARLGQQAASDDGRPASRVSVRSDTAPASDASTVRTAPLSIIQSVKQRKQTLAIDDLREEQEEHTQQLEAYRQSREPVQRRLRDRPCSSPAGASPPEAEAPNGKPAPSASTMGQVVYTDNATSRLIALVPRSRQSDRTEVAQSIASTRRHRLSLRREHDHFMADLRHETLVKAGEFWAANPLPTAAMQRFMKVVYASRVEQSREAVGRCGTAHRPSKHEASAPRHASDTFITDSVKAFKGLPPSH